ncbi:TorF family putative porin [Sphingomonas aestuarii]
MRFSTLSLSALALAATATPAFAQETDIPPPVSVSSTITLTSDYRFRGITQSDEGPAAQAGITVSHESGFYVGGWASSISTNSLPGYGEAETNLFGGFSTETASGIGFDVGLLYYLYPDAVSGAQTDFFEPYAAITYSIGPVSTKLGAAYAWGGQDGLDFTGGKDDNLYLYADASVGIPTTPLTLNAHVGRSEGSLALLNIDASDVYWDWSAGVEWSGGPIVGGVKYIDTDISNAGRFAQSLGRGSTVVGYVGFSF